MSIVKNTLNTSVILRRDNENSNINNITKSILFLFFNIIFISNFYSQTFDYTNLSNGIPSIKIGKLEIAQHDFPREMTWWDAKKACESLGKGWRLPTTNELLIIYKNKNKINGLKSNMPDEPKYWSNKEVANTAYCDNNSRYWEGVKCFAISFCFCEEVYENKSKITHEVVNGWLKDWRKEEKFNVRPVRSF